jgi:thiol:disulfide interchange protein DsbG
MNRRHFTPLLAAIFGFPSIAYAQPQSTPPEGAALLTPEAWKSLLQLPGLSVAKPGQILQALIFFDPNCPFCAKLWKWISQESAPVQAHRWIPVAYMDKTSEPRAIAMLRGSADGAAALAQNFAQFDQSKRVGLTPPAQNVTLQEREAIRRTGAAWSRIIGATPLMIYRTKDNQVWRQAGFVSEDRRSQIVASLAPANLSTFSP